MIQSWPKRPRIRLNQEAYALLRRQILERDGWRCQDCRSSQNLQIHHQKLRRQSGHDSEENLITVCVQRHYADTYDFEERWDLPFHDYGLGMTAFASPEYALSVPCEFTPVTT